MGVVIVGIGCLAYIGYLWKKNQCCHGYRLKHCCKCCHCECSCNCSCDCWVCCHNGCYQDGCCGSCCPESAPPSSVTSGVTVRRFNSFGDHESILSYGETDIDQVITVDSTYDCYVSNRISPSAPPAVTVQPVSDFEIYRPELLVETSERNRNDPTNDIPTFEQAMEMEIVPSGNSNQPIQFMHQTSSKSDDLPPAYKSFEFHPVLLPGNTYFSYPESLSVPSGTKL